MAVHLCSPYARDLTHELTFSRSGTSVELIAHELPSGLGNLNWDYVNRASVLSTARGRGNEGTVNLTVNTRSWRYGKDLRTKAPSRTQLLHRIDLTYRTIVTVKGSRRGILNTLQGHKDALTILTLPLIPGQCQRTSGSFRLRPQSASRLLVNAP